MDSPWYVARVRPGLETRSVEHLTAVGFETFAPTQLHRSTIRGRPAEHYRAVYAGYVFCRAVLSAELWHAACDDTPFFTSPIASFVGGWPADPVPAATVEDMRARCDDRGVWLEDPPPIASLLPPGTVVRVLDASFSDHTFVVVWDDGRGVNLKGTGHGVLDRLYIARERVEAFKKNKPTLQQTRRRTIGFRRVRSYA